MNVWLIGATALLFGLLPCGFVLVRGRLIGFQCSQRSVPDCPDDRQQLHFFFHKSRLVLAANHINSALMGFRLKWHPRDSFLRAGDIGRAKINPVLGHHGYDTDSFNQVIREFEPQSSNEWILWLV